MPLGALPSGQAGGWVHLDLMVILGRQFVAGHHSYVKLGRFLRDVDTSCVAVGRDVDADERGRRLAP
jgi:hypothetical protein